MNRLTHTVYLTIIAVVLIGGVAVAGMYWDQNQDPEATTDRTARDARSLTPSPSTAPPPHPVKMYDDNQVLQVDSFDEPRTTRAPIVEPQRPAASTAPAQARRLAPVPSGPTRQTIVPRSERRQTVERARPQPVQSAPGMAEKKHKDARTIEPGVVQKPEHAKELEAVSPPVTKRMPWGKTDLRPEQKTNLRWGRPKQEQ